jgi:hypothetical protein
MIPPEKVVMARPELLRIPYKEHGRFEHLGCCDVGQFLAMIGSVLGFSVHLHLFDAAGQHLRTEFDGG